MKNDTMDFPPEIIRGRVSLVDESAGFLRIRRMNEKTGRAEEVKISVPRSTKLKGIEFLDALEIDTEVEVEVRRNNGSGYLEARRIAVRKNGESGGDTEIAA